MASPECAQWCCPLHSKPVKVCLSSVSVCLQPDRSALQLLCKLKHYCLSEVYKHASLIWSLFPVWWQRTESRRRFSPDLMTSAQEERHRNYSAAVTSEPSPADVQRRWTGKKSRAGRLLKDRRAQAFVIYQQNTERRDSDLTQHELVSDVKSSADCLGWKTEIQREREIMRWTQVKSKRVQLSKVSSVGKDEFWVSFSTRQVLIGQVGSGRLPSQHVTLWWVGSVLFWLVWTVFSQLAFIMTVCQSTLINAVWIKLLLLPILACLSSCSLKTSMLVSFVSSCCIFLK